MSPPPGIPAGPYVAAGRIVFSRGGTFTTQITQSFAGNVVPTQATTGVYAINADCTGTATDSNGGAYYFVVSRNRGSILFMLTNPGVVAKGTAKR